MDSKVWGFAFGFDPTRRILVFIEPDEVMLTKNLRIRDER
jgi:hypothetical protein